MTTYGATPETKPKVLDWEPGLYFDESSRTLAEVTASLFDTLTSEGFTISAETAETVSEITRDERSGLYQHEDAESLDWAYEELVEIVNEHLRGSLGFSYENEAGGWGVWDWEHEGMFL